MSFDHQPPRAVSFCVGHPGANATVLFGRGAQPQVREFLLVDVHARQVGCHQLIGQDRAVKKLLQQSAPVIGPWLCPAKTIGRPLFQCSK